MTSKIFATGALFILCASSASAINVWDEGVDGDLSGDPLAPTVVAFSVGSNTITGSMAAPDDIRDYFTFTVEANQRLTSITLTQYVDLDVGGPGNTGYAHIDDGNTSVIPGGDTMLDFLGGAHITPDLVGQDLLAILAAAAMGGVGFSAPLGPGAYTFNIQQTGPQLTGYSLDFKIKAVPIPAAAWLLASALPWLFGRRRKS